MRQAEESSKTETAYRLLRRDILSARLGPRSPLRISALSKRYGLGWTPLREALSRLEAERLVTAINNRGFAVAPVSRKELEDLSRARMVVEVPLLMESIENGGDDWQSAVVTAHYRLSRCKTAIEDSSDEALDDWDEMHEAFHAALLNAATSNWMMRFRLTISDQLRRHHRFLSLIPTLRAAEGRKDGYEEAVTALENAQSLAAHTALMDAALARNLDRSQALMIEHIGHTLDVFLHTEEQADSAQRNGRRKLQQAAGQ